MFGIVPIRPLSMMSRGRSRLISSKTLQSQMKSQSEKTLERKAIQQEDVADLLVGCSKSLWTHRTYHYMTDDLSSPQRENENHSDWC
jgi:hypothetical protein